MSATHLPGVSDHARLRMAERYGRDLDDGSWLALVATILNRKAVMMRRDRKGRERYACPVAGLTVCVVWCPTAALVATVLPWGHDTALTTHARARGAR